MATTTETPRAGNGGASQPLTRRDRAFLGLLPDDFLRVVPTQTDQHRPPQQQPGREHLVPMTYAPHAYVRPQEVILGRLRVTVAQAKLSKNYGFTRMDPYCRIRVGHSVYETPTDTNGSKNPRWNKVFSCNVPRGVNSLYVEIFNERYLALDDRIAWAYFEFPEDLFNGETVEEWIPLNGKLGDGQEGNVNLILSFTSTPPPTSFQLTAYGNQPVSMMPTAMPAAQMYYQGGYPPGYPAAYPPAQVPPQQQLPPAQGVPPQEVQQPANQIKEEDVKELKEMFPALEEEVIRSVLEASGGRVDSAVTNLLAMTDAQDRHVFERYYSLMSLLNNGMDPDDEELLFDPLLDLSHCSDFDNESILYSESLLLGDDDHTNTEIPAVKVKIEKDEESRVSIDRRDIVGKSGNEDSQKIEPGSGDKHTETTKPIRSTIIKLNNAKKFRYVPEALPSVELPSLARKRKRPASITTLVRDIEPTLSLEPKRRNTENSQDLRPKIQQSREAPMYRQFSSPSVSNGARSVCRVARETHPMCSSLHDKEPLLSPSSHIIPSQRKVLLTSPTAIPTSGVSSHVSSNKRLRKLTSCSEALHVEVSTNSFSSGISSLGRTTVFATRPGLINRSNPAKFSLHHLGAGNTLKFSLDHL